MEKQLESLKKEIDKLLKEFLDKKQREAKKLNPVYDELVKHICKIILSGGKRLRPILVYYGYQSANASTKRLSDQQLLSFSLCTELFHTACLIHDDLMDNAHERHGVLTVHKYFEKYLSRHSGLPALNVVNVSRINPLNDSGVALRAPQNDAKKELARNLAILAGDLCLIWADELLTDFRAEKEVPKKVLQIYDQLREEVIFGQTMDMVLSRHCEERPAGWQGATWQSKSRRRLPRPFGARNDIYIDSRLRGNDKEVNSFAMTKESIFKMYTFKTAKYSFERPLQLGSALAGANEKTLQVLSDYAIPVGIAFQIQDDILGVFGKDIGKDADSDIKEGKETLLIAISKFKIHFSQENLFKASNSKFKKKLEKILGNENATAKDVAWVRNLIKNTGALKDCQSLAKENVQTAKEVLRGGNLSLKTREFLNYLADFCVRRRY